MVTPDKPGGTPQKYSPEERKRAKSAGYTLVAENKPASDPKPKPVLTPASPRYNPDSVTGRFPTRSPRP